MESYRAVLQILNWQTYETVAPEELHKDVNLQGLICFLQPSKTEGNNFNVRKEFWFTFATAIHHKETVNVKTTVCQVECIQIFLYGKS